MQIIKAPLQLPETTYQITDIDTPSRILFFDIETTGFRAKSSSLYLIGLIYFEEQTLMATQLFAESPDDEKSVLEEFIRICKAHGTLLHYNGNTFDIPYLREKCRQYSLSAPFDDLSGVDLYRRLSGFKNILHLENCKQKTIERWIGIDREDQYTGGELIDVYEDFVKTQAEESRHLLLLHNLDDLKGMYELLPVLSYMDMLLVPFRVVKVLANVYCDLDGRDQTEVVMKIRFHSPFPHPITMQKQGCRFSGEGKEGFLKVPLTKEPVKYYYSNYQDYYYLPYEDVALHKSVASFVDKDSRQQASARTCYTKKDGAFLPQWDVIFEPFFKKDYDDNTLYFELTDEMKRQPEAFRKYALHLLDMLIHAKEN